MASKLELDYRKSSSDVLYFNASFTNIKDTPQIIDFRQSRAQNIINKSNDYYLAITRFSIPHNVIPIFNFEDDKYFVSIGVGLASPLVYKDQGNPISTVYPNRKGIYYIQQFLDMINTALAIAHGLDPRNAPRMVLDEDGRFSLIVDTAYIPGVPADEIFFSKPLYQLFEGLNSEFISYNSVNKKDYKIIYGDKFNNIFTYQAPLVGNYYEMKQENKSQFIWSDVASIAISTANLPCRKEYLGYRSQTNSTNEAQLITDFIPVQSEPSNYDRSNWLYNSGSGFRLVELETDNPLNIIDFRVSIVTKEGTLEPLAIAPGKTASVKFMFIKKSLENNEYNGLKRMGDSFKADILGIKQTNRITGDKRLY